MTYNTNTISSQNISQPPNRQNNQIHQSSSFKEEQNPVLLENIQLPESPSIIYDILKTQMDWTNEIPHFPSNISAPTNPELT
jgi:hypothetical protein